MQVLDVHDGCTTGLSTSDKVKKEAIYCEQCGEHFKSKQDLQQHVGRQHTRYIDWKFICDTCVTLFPDEVSLKEHMKTCKRHKKSICFSSFR